MVSAPKLMTPNVYCFTELGNGMKEKTPVYNYTIAVKVTDRPLRSHK